MQNDKEKQLKSVVSAIKDSDITEDSLNEFKQSTGITITVFNGNIREISTVKGAIGTKADDTIYNLVMNNGSYFSSNANVNGEPYFAYYEKTDNGMISAGITKSEMIS